MSSRPEWKGKYDELKLTADAVNRELSDFVGRDSAMQSRAAILIGAASVVGALKISNPTDWFAFAQLGLTFLAAVCGLVMIFPRRGNGFNARTMRDEAYKGASTEELLHHAVRVKIDNLDDDEKRLKVRGAFARLGFVLLALSIVAALLGTLPTHLGSPPPPVPMHTGEHHAS
jgi:hypothetical protein